MYTHLKFYLNYFEQQIQQENNKKIKILKKLKIKKYNIEPGYNKEKLRKNK